MALSASPAFHAHTTGPVTVVRFVGPRLDYSHIEAMADELDALVDRPGQRELRLDFRDVEYLSSNALGKLVGLHTRAARAGCRLVVTNLQPLVHDIFAITRLDTFLDIHGVE